MNIILPLALLLLSGVSSRVLKCPQPSGKFSIENSLCKSYYECENWVITREQICPQGQNFDPIRQRCDYEELYYCVEEALEKYKRCKKASGKFPKENSSCRTYYQCEKWKVTGESTCPLGQNFNPEMQWCDWEEIYPCLEDTHSSKCPKPTGVFPKPGSQCKRYYKCTNGRAQEHQCPDDLIFDPHQSLCEWPELVACDETKEKTTPAAMKTTLITSTTPQQISTTEEHLSTETTETISTTKGYTTVPSEQTSADSETEQTGVTTEDRISTFTVEVSESTKTDGPVNPESTATEGFTTLETSGNSEIVTTVFRPEWSTSASAKETESTVGTTEDYTLTREQPTLDTKTEGIEEKTTFSKEGLSSTETEGIDKTSEGHTNFVTEETSEGPITTSELDTKHPTEQTASGGETGTTVASTVSDGKSTKPNATIAGTSTVTNPHGTASVPTDIPGEVICPREHGLFPHPTNKHKFVACVGFVPFIMDCPSDLIYDPKLEACAWNKPNRL